MVGGGMSAALDQLAVLAEVVLGPWVVAVATRHVFAPLPPLFQFTVSRVQLFHGSVLPAFNCDKCDSYETLRWDLGPHRPLCRY